MTLEAAGSPPVPTPRTGRGASLLSLLGGAVSGGSMFVLSILVARTLDQVDFADFVFCLALSQLWFVPTIAGLELAGPRYLATQPSDRRGVAAGTVLAMSGTLALLVAFLALPFASWLADTTSSPVLLVYLAAAFGVATGLRAVAERLTAALGRVGAVAAVKGLESTVIVVAAAWLLIGGIVDDWSGPAAVVLAAACIAVASYLVIIRRGAGRFSADRDAVRELARFARHAAPTTLFAVVMMYVDKFAMRLGSSAVDYAVYSAYFAGTLLIAVQAVFVLQSVVLPASARSASSGLVRTRVATMLPRLALVLPLVYVASGFVVLRLLGPQYPYQLHVGAIFAAWATAYTINILGVTAIVARSTPAMRRESRVLVLRCVVALAALWALDRTGSTSITSVVATMLLLELAETANVWLMLRRYLPTG